MNDCSNPSSTRILIAGVASAVSPSGMRIPRYPGVRVLESAMPPAKRHMVLTVEAMVQPRRPGSRVGIYVTVNGQRIETPLLHVDASSPKGAVRGGCALDVDAAETRYPGCFRRKPLRLELFAFDADGREFTAGAAVIRGKLQKKAGPASCEASSGRPSLQ